MEEVVISFSVAERIWGIWWGDRVHIFGVGGVGREEREEEEGVVGVVGREDGVDVDVGGVEGKVTGVGDE